MNEESPPVCMHACLHCGSYLKYYVLNGGTYFLCVNVECEEAHAFNKCCETGDISTAKLLDHHLVVVNTVRQYEGVASVNSNGDLVMSGHIEDSDYIESWINCDDCGTTLTFDDFDAHGVSEDWESV